MPTDHTETQSDPNISTEHQRGGDARRPSDTLDRGQSSGHTVTQSHPSSGTEADEDDRIDTPGGNAQEEVEDRPNVGVVEPEDYPEQQ